MSSCKTKTTHLLAFSPKRAQACETKYLLLLHVIYLNFAIKASLRDLSALSCMMVPRLSTFLRVGSAISDPNLSWWTALGWFRSLRWQRSLGLHTGKVVVWTVVVVLVSQSPQSVLAQLSNFKPHLWSAIFAKQTASKEKLQPLKCRGKGAPCGVCAAEGFIPKAHPEDSRHRPGWLALTLPE